MLLLVARQRLRFPPFTGKPLAPTIRLVDQSTRSQFSTNCSVYLLIIDAKGLNAQSVMKLAPRVILFKDTHKGLGFGGLDYKREGCGIAPIKLLERSTQASALE
jgi:hypothetical protein